MTNVNKTDFNPGGLLDRVDNRDYMWEEVGGATISAFDWTKGFNTETEIGNLLNIPNFKITIKDQGASFSCGGQAWGYLAEVLEALNTGTYEPRSAKYMYAQTCVPDGGSRGRDNADIFVSQGVAREAVLTSYEHSLPPSEAFMQRSIDIKDNARQDAKLSKASAYAQTGVDIESIADAIKRNHGVILGIDGSNNGTWQSAFPKPPLATTWRHWVYAFAAKLIDGKKHIGIVNSWGKSAGDNGIQWLSSDYFRYHVFSGWTHVFAPLPPVTFKHNFTTNLHFNEINDEVKALQTALKIEGLFPTTVPSSGLYGNITRTAVLQFQWKYKIITDASQSDEGRIVGPKTRITLNTLFNK